MIKSSTTNQTKKIVKPESNDILSTNDFICDSLYIDTTNSSITSSMLG
jgi:hypothetical protein